MDKWVLNEMAFTVEVIIQYIYINKTWATLQTTVSGVCTMRQVNVWYRYRYRCLCVCVCELALQNWIAHKTLLRIKLVSFYWLKMDDLKWLNELRFAFGHSVFFFFYFFDIVWLNLYIYHSDLITGFVKTCVWFYRIQIQIDYNTVIRLQFFASLFDNKNKRIRNRCRDFWLFALALSLFPSVSSTASFWQMWYNFYGCLLVLFYGFGFGFGLLLLLLF